MRDVHGVNLGGWLVLEKWISPSLFAGTTAGDEYSLCQQLGPAAAKRLKIHRDSFITADHIKRLAEQKINCLRLPVGYWLFGGEPPFIEGADSYVDQVFDWAGRYGLDVILDFHAAPGSQNGNDHSGRAGDVKWTQPANINKSLDFIDRLTRRYGQQPRLLAVEVLNEPGWVVAIDDLIDYYSKADQIIQANCHNGVQTIVHDGFRPLEMNQALDIAGLKVVLDVHLYQLFTPEDRSLNLKGHIKKTQKEWKRLLRQLAESRPVLVGEWSAAMHELYQDIDQPDWHYTAADYQKYFEVQKRTFEKAPAGWTYWTARVEGGGVWSLLDQPEWAV